MTFKYDVPTERSIVSSYKRGESILSLSQRYDTGRSVISRIIKKNGVVSRTQSEQELIKWSGMTIKERALQTAGAQVARRGQKDSLATRLARTQSRYEAQTSIGKREREFAELLDAAGIEYRQQLPCGVYNLDFALTRYCVAVEIVMGPGNSRQTAAYKRKRTKYVLSKRHLFEVIATNAISGRHFRSKIIEKLVAFANVTRLHEPSPGQHRMVRPDGEALGTRPKVYRRTSKSGTHYLVHRAIGSDGRSL
ncbi:MAG TPA: hypothetical protein VIJ35_05660 [Bradyrhizobium sp.]